VVDDETIKIESKMRQRGRKIGSAVCLRTEVCRKFHRQQMQTTNGPIQACQGIVHRRSQRT